MQKQEVENQAPSAAVLQSDRGLYGILFECETRALVTMDVYSHDKGYSIVHCGMKYAASAPDVSWSRK